MNLPTLRMSITSLHVCTNQKGNVMSWAFQGEPCRLCVQGWGRFQGALEGGQGTSERDGMFEC
jgi:hypothetical protein